MGSAPSGTALRVQASPGLQAAHILSRMCFHPFHTGFAGQLEAQRKFPSPLTYPSVFVVVVCRPRQGPHPSCFIHFFSPLIFLSPISS